MCHCWDKGIEVCKQYMRKVKKMRKILEKSKRDSKEIVEVFSYVSQLQNITESDLFEAEVSTFIHRMT